MDFLEDLELYNSAMDNAFNLITGRVLLEDMFIEMERGEDDILPLPFNPLLVGTHSEDVIDLLIEHFTGFEEYEKCAELVKIKQKYVKGHKPS